LIRSAIALVVATAAAVVLAPPAQAHHRVLKAAGDIACAPGAPVTPSTCQQRATARLLGGTSHMAMLGDAQYEHGTLREFQQVYARTWGRYKSITYPVPGNHEYETPGARGYFDYFGERARRRDRGYYSFTMGSWLVLALNSNCSKLLAGCTIKSPQVRWLEERLRSSRKRCILAYWHHPRFSSSQRGHRPSRGFWRVLYHHRADVVLNGHAHVYERFRRLRPNGNRTRRGIRQFIVGTGGANHGDWRRIHRNSQRRSAKTFGVLKLRLLPRSYAWQFQPVAGKRFTDTGRTKCHT
jgi:acid phosphatase type 7